MTGIVGLEGEPNARENLIKMYNRTLKEIQEVPSVDEGYRKAVESFTRYCLKICQEEEDWEVIEKKISCRQVEELLQEAHHELTLKKNMMEWDPWVKEEQKAHKYFEEEEDDAPVPDEVYETPEAVSSG